MKYQQLKSVVRRRVVAGPPAIGHGQGSEPSGSKGMTEPGQRTGALRREREHNLRFHG